MNGAGGGSYVRFVGANASSKWRCVCGKVYVVGSCPGGFFCVLSVRLPSPLKKDKFERLHFCLLLLAFGSLRLKFVMLSVRILDACLQHGW